MALLMALKRAGGIDPAMLPDMGQENGFMTNRKLPGLVRRGGFTEDGLLEWMQQNGYLHNQQISEADEYQPGGAHELARELVSAALHGTNIVQIGSEDEFYSERANREYEDYMEQEKELAAVPMRRPPGRPKLADGVRKTIVLDVATIAKAELLGGGNLSLGLRMAVASLAASADVDPQPGQPAI